MGKNVTKPKILLLGNYRPTLPIARLLSGRGYDVVAGARGPEPVFRRSRYLFELWDHPDGPHDPEHFFEALQKYGSDHPELTAIFPLLEDYVRLFADHPEWRTALPPLIMAAPELEHRCLDKLGMMQLVRGLDIPMAPFAEAVDLETFRNRAEEIGLPLVIRPAIAQVALNGKKARSLATVEELANFDADWKLHAKGVLLQRHFAGLRHNLYFAAHEGRICRYLHAVILRTDRLDGSGLALEGVTIEPDAALRGYAEKLTQALNYSGIGCIQFLVDDATGAVSFLEINPRVAGNAVVPEAAELELAGFLVDLVLSGQPDTASRTGCGGLRYAWTSADIIAAKRAWRLGELRGLETVCWLGRALWAGLRAHVHILFSWSDPRPGWAALLQALPGINRVGRG